MQETFYDESPNTLPEFLLNINFIYKYYLY